MKRPAALVVPKVLMRNGSLHNLAALEDFEPLSGGLVGA